MKNYRWLLAVALAVIIVLGFWIWRRGTIPQEIDLVGAYPTAEKRSSISPEKAFRVVNVTIDRVSQRGIFMHPTSRLIFKVTVPQNALLRTSMALMPEIWDEDGADGVLFRFGVSDGRKYDELLNQIVNPHTVLEDRRWVPVAIDLSAYGGQQVDLIFNTNSSAPRRPANSSYDWAVWGDPRVTIRDR